MNATTTIFLYVVLRGAVEDRHYRYVMPNMNVCQEVIKTSQHKFSSQQIRESGTVLFCAGESQFRYAGEWIKDKSKP